MDNPRGRVQARSHGVLLSVLHLLPVPRALGTAAGMLRRPEYPVVHRPEVWMPRLVHLL